MEFLKKYYLLILSIILYLIIYSGIEIGPIKLLYFILVAFIPFFKFLSKEKENLFRSLFVILATSTITSLMMFTWAIDYSLKIYFIMVATSIILTSSIYLSIIIIHKKIKNKKNTLIILPLILCAELIFISQISMYTTFFNPAMALYELGILLNFITINVFSFLIIISQNLIINKKTKKYGIIILLVFVGVILFNNIKTELVSEQETISVGLIQGNFFNNWNERTIDYEKIFLFYYVKSLVLLKDKPDLIVWPEYSIAHVMTDKPLMLEKIYNLSNKHNVVFVIGTMGKVLNKTYEIGDPFYDSALIIFPNKTYVQYNSSMVPPLNKNIAAKDELLIFKVKNKKIGLLLCWEESNFKKGKKYSEREIDYLISLSNYQRFNKNKEIYNLGAYMHRIQASMNNYKTIRVSNTGITETTNSDGVVIDQFKLFEELEKVVRI